MANITEILGTDSVSSSRPIINSNFELLNDELASVISLLNPTTLTLEGLLSVTSENLIISQAGVNLLSVSNLGAVFSTATTFGSSVSIGGSLIKSGVLGSKSVPTTQVTPTSIEAITYFVDVNFTLPEAVDGQEVTIINVDSDSKSILAGPNVFLAAGSITLDGLNSTVTLRCFEDTWYVISSQATTVVVTTIV